MRVSEGEGFSQPRSLLCGGDLLRDLGKWRAALSSEALAA